MSKEEEIVSEWIRLGRKTRSARAGSVSMQVQYRNILQTLANSIFVNRDTSVEPCNNFYDFVCGGWIKNNPVPENKTSWDMFEEASEVVNNRLKEILEREQSSEDNQAIKDARKYYQACVDVDRHSKRNMQILQDRLSEWGGWPIISKKWKKEKFDWKKLTTHLIRTYDLAPLLRLSVDTNRHNTSENILVVDEADALCRPFMGENGVNEWFDFILDIAKFVAKASYKRLPKRRLIMEDALAFIKLQAVICESLTPTDAKENDLERYHVMTIKELQNLTDADEPVKEYAKINWLDLFRDFLEGADVEIDEDVQVVVKDPNYVLQLIRSIDEDKVNERIIANYMLWTLVFHLHEDISPALRQLSYGYKEKTVGASGAEPRWQTCVAKTNEYFKHALGYEYVKLYFDEDAKRNAEELVWNIRDSFIEELKEIDWMDGRTRAAAIEKAENLIVHVGYPEWYDDVTNIDNYYSEYVIGNFHILNEENVVGSMSLNGVKSLVQENDRETWISEVAIVNAYYSTEMNSISIPAGIFQWPFYVKGRPESLNYGAIGSVIGHEISHAFDAQGRMADKFGNIAQWWSSETLRTYLLKKDCIQEQYSQYPVPELNQETEHEDWPKELDGVGTLSENIADIGGIQEAYTAYLRLINENGTEPRLPGLTHYSHQQLFYIGYSTVWCVSGTQNSLVEDILMDVHTPSKYRVLIPLGNSNGFADAWKCRQNDFEMNPAHKCNFW